MSLVTSLLAVVFIYSISAQASNEFDSWKKQQLNDFSEYKSKQDKEFAQFLKAHWVEIKSQQGEPLYDKKKIKKQPTAPRIVEKKVPAKPVIIKSPIPKPILIKTKPVISKPVPVPDKELLVSISFFGNELSFPYDRKIRKTIGSTIDKEAISKQWSVLAKSDYEPMLKQLHSARKSLGLNDWAYAVLVNQLASEIYAGKTNDQAIFGWFIFIKSGYKARLAYEKNRVFLLLPIKQKVYSAQSLTYAGQKYYVLDFDGGKQPRVGSLFTYDSEYQGSHRILDLHLKDLFSTDKTVVSRDLSFRYNNKDYKIHTSNNPDVIEFMRTYPQVHWDVYFNARPINKTRQQLADQLRPLVNGMNEVDAVNLLLRFVQKSLKYNTDDKQFGFENPLFVEETLYYPASDCEDRSVLFSWLVKELLGLDVVGLLYPGHMATAVRLNMKVDGDRVSYKGKTYYVADPTYTNADIGMAMPKFSNKKPEFIAIL